MARGKVRHESLCGPIGPTTFSRAKHVIFRPPPLYIYVALRTAAMNGMIASPPILYTPGNILLGFPRMVTDLSGDMAEGKVRHEPLLVVPLERLADVLPNINNGGRYIQMYGDVTSGSNQKDPRLE